jgi:hypothetical protein
MRITALTCPSWTPAHPPLPAALRPRAVPERPGKDDLADLLNGVDRVLVAGSDADLAAVVLRLLRTERLAGTEVAYLPSDPASAAAEVWGLPVDATASEALATHGTARAVPLVRDDSGGVLVGRGELRGVRGEAYCDAELVLRGRASRLVVTPSVPDGVEVRVREGGWRRRMRAATGRALQIGCLESTVTCDGVPHPRPVKRWTWYRHTEDLRLVLPG